MTLEEIIQFDTALDHLTGEELGMALESLNNMPEVLDAIFLPGIGKKNRPAGLLQVICRPEFELCVRDAIFRHTHALGIRRQVIERYILERRAASVKVAGETVPAKAHLLEDKLYVRPEAEGIRELARKFGAGAPGLRFEDSRE